MAIEVVGDHVVARVDDLLPGGATTALLVDDGVQDGADGGDDGAGRAPGEVLRQLPVTDGSVRFRAVEPGSYRLRVHQQLASEQDGVSTSSQVLMSSARFTLDEVTDVVVCLAAPVA